MKRHKGFTIIELLVVIAIFAAMFALLTPVVKVVKARAARINCANDLRHLSIGLHLYAIEHNEEFPPNLAALYPNYVKDEKILDHYIYVPGLKESSPETEVIVYDRDGNHKARGRNILRINGSVEWTRNIEGKPR